MIKISDPFNCNLDTAVVPTNTKIVHLGATSRFFRAHWADVVNDVLAIDPSWGIAAISMRPHEAGGHPRLDAFKRDGGIYELLSIGFDNEQVRKKIHSVIDNISLHHEYERVMAVMSNPQTEIFSLTVTDSGYYKKIGHVLDSENEFIQNDLKQFANYGNGYIPQSPIALLAAALQERMLRNQKGVIVLSLDNFEGNGDLIQSLVLDFASKVNQDLEVWCRENVNFPNTAADRITPHLRGIFAQEASSVPIVIAEPERELVIELPNDKFPQCFRDIGVQTVEDASLYFQRKLRVLNRTHTLICVLLRQITDGEHDPKALVSLVFELDIEEFLKKLLYQEVAPTMQCETQDMRVYIDATIKRLRNPNLGDSVERIDVDPERKIPKYLFSGIVQAEEAGLEHYGHSIILASWIKSIACNNPKGYVSKDIEISCQSIRDAALNTQGGKRAAATRILEIMQGNVFWDACSENKALSLQLAHYVSQLECISIDELMAVYLQEEMNDNPLVKFGIPLLEI